MRVIVASKPLAVDVDGKKGRVWTGKTEDGRVAHVAMVEGPTSGTLIVDIEIVDLLEGSEPK